MLYGRRVSPVPSTGTMAKLQRHTINQSVDLTSKPHLARPRHDAHELKPLPLLRPSKEAARLHQLHARLRRLHHVLAGRVDPRRAAHAGRRARASSRGLVYKAVVWFKVG